MAKKPAIADVLYALSDPLRLKIVQRLADEGETACGEFEVHMPKSSLSHHFKVLREAGVISTRGEGVRRLNTLRREELDAAFPGLLDAILGVRLRARRQGRRSGSQRQSR